MRQIKFRAWDGYSMTTSQMLSITMNGQLEYDGGSVGVSPIDYPLMQFTGLTDKNGTDVYEGDIVSQERNCMYHAGRHNKEVAFIGDQFCSGDCSVLSAIECFDAKVIGNIHQDSYLLNENPELLEQQE